MNLKVSLFSLLLMALPVAALADAPVSITPMASFSGMSPRGGVYPITVTLHNAGGSADGALIVQSESYSSVLRTYVYPVSLPTGTDKEIVVYPLVTADTNAVDFSFQGNSHADKVNLPVNFTEGRQVGMIGDEPGALATLKQQPPTSSQPSQPYGTPPNATITFNDCYARPEDAPDRAAGYQAMSYLVLSEGAERLRPEQWDAIRHWVMDGGSVILTGGAGATYLRVAEAGSLLPISKPCDTTLPSLSFPDGVSKVPPPIGPVALVSGAMQPGAFAAMTDGGKPLVIRQSLGAGTVLLVGFNPLDEPFKDWAGQHDLWMWLIKESSPNLSGWSMRQWTTQQTSFTTYRSMSPAGPQLYDTNGVDPFRIKLPPVSTIAWMLIAYFILVIPVSFFILKRLKRLELAWFTSPLISVSFAYAFYLFTAQLYLAEMSQRTAGIIVTANGAGDAQFDGFSEMFIPRGGSYQIVVPGAEAIELSPFGQSDSQYGYYSGGGSQDSLQSLTTVDIGSVAAHNFGVGNLAFSRVYHTEPVSLGGPITVDLARTNDGGFTGTVHNGSTQTLYNAFIYEPGSARVSPVGDLQPQDSRDINRTEDVRQSIEYANSPFGNFTTKQSRPGSNTAYLIARTAGSGFGPSNLGKDVGGPSSVVVLVSVPITKGGPL
jgi:hypothetical protein